MTTKLLAFNNSKSHYESLVCDDDGKLLVSGISGGGGSGGDASADNQLTQIEVAEASNLAIHTQLETQTDRLLYDTDIIANQLTNSNTVLSSIDVSTNNMEIQLDNVLAELQGGYLQEIDTHLTPLQQGVARYTIDAKTTLAPDTVPAYSAPVSGIPASEGWYYKNTSAGNTSQLYYYANQASQTRNHDYTISAIESQWAVVRLLNLNSGTVLPFLVVYSQPQGDGLDIIPGFARSSWVYQVATGQELRLGEKILIYRGVVPDSRIYPELRRVESSLTITRGPALTSELLAYATLNSDSGAPVNTVEYIVGGAGLSFIGDNVYKVELTGETAAVEGDASSSNQVLQLNAATNSNLAVCSRLDSLGLINTNLDQLTFTNSDLQVSDSQVYSELLSLNAKIDGLTDSVAASLKIVGDVQNYKYDPINNESVREIVDVNGIGYTHAFVETVNGPITSSSVGGDESYNAMHTEIKGTVSVTETNPISDYALETTLQNIKTQTDKLLFDIKGEDTNGALSVIVQSGSIQCSLVSGGGSALTASFMPNDIIALDTYVSNDYLDTHLYGRENNGDWVGIKVAGNGHLIVNSSTQDADGNDITSQLTDTGRALDVRMHAYDLANDLNTSLQIGEYKGLYVETPPSTSLVVSKGVGSYAGLYSGALGSNSIYGSLSVGNFSMCDIMVKIPAGACTSAGTLRVLFSETGNSDWFETSITVSIGLSTSEKLYWLHVPSFCMGFLAVGTSSGTGGLTTTDSVIRVCVKK